MFEQTFKNVDDILHKDAGCGSELDYVEQTSWVLFLKYLDDLEEDKKNEALLTGKTYQPIIAHEFKWNTWAAPKDKEGKIDHHTALTGDDLADFVNNQLFNYLKKFKTSAESADTIEYKIGEIFSELKNRIQSGYNLREVINRIDELRFRTHAEKHEMSHLYEDKIKNMGNAGRNGGEYYTPRPLIRTIVKVVNPQIGEKVYDGAVGSAGFLCEAFDYMRSAKNLSTTDIETLQKNTFYGKEKKSLAYIIGIMNMILHGVEAPNILHTNTLTENLADIQDKDRFDVVLANPPFGGKERAEVQQNFPIKTGDTASLFMQHFVKMMKAGGRAGVVIKNTFLSNTDNASVSLRKMLLENCNLHTVLDLPVGTFTGAGVKTVVLFFEKGMATDKVWFYQLNLDRNLGKTNPLNEKDLAEFIELQKTFADSDNSWSIKVADLDANTFDLSAKNPNKKEEAALLEPKVIIKKLKKIDADTANILNSIELLENELQLIFDENSEAWKTKKLKDICEKITDGTHQTPKYFDEGFVFLSSKNVTSGKIDWNNVKYIDEKQHLEMHKRVSPKIGDILLAKNGTTGVAAMVDRDVVFDIYVSLAWIRSKGEVIPEFLLYFINSSTAKKQFNKRLKGSGVPNLHLEEIREVEISFPESLNTQQTIVSKLDALREQTQKLEAVYVQKLQDLEELKKSVLQKAFSGEL